MLSPSNFLSPTSLWLLIKQSKIIILLPAILVGHLILSTIPVMAQESLGVTNQLRSEVYQLRTEVYSLRQELASNRQNGVNQNQGSSNIFFEGRLSQLEKELRSLTGLVERLTYDQSQLAKKVENLEGARQTTESQNTPVASPLPQLPSKGPSETNEALPSFEEVPVPTPRPSSTNGSSISAPTGSPDHYAYAYDFIKLGNYENAEHAFQSFVDKYPQNKLVSNAYYWLGESHYARGGLNEAAVSFARGFQANPSSPKAPDNLLKLGMSLYGLGDIPQACSTLDALLTSFPEANLDLLQKANDERERMGCP